MRRVRRLLSAVLWSSALVAASALTPRPLHAQEQEPEMVLPACGIRYPGGFDPNTVGVVEGTASGITRPARGPVSFRLDAGGDTYTVLAAPAWYWDELKAAVRDGDRMRVKGSKTMGADGDLYLIAREIVPLSGGKPLVLRDERGRQHWSGCGPRGCGGHGR